MPNFKRALSVLSLCLLVLPAMLRAGEDAPKPADSPDKPRRMWQQLRPERLVAEDALLYLSTPDMTKLKTAFERTALNGLLGEEEIRNPVLATFAKLRDTYIKGDSTRTDAEVRRRTDEVDLLTRLAPLLDGQVAVALSAPPEAGERLPHFLIIASMPSEDRQRELEALLDKYRYGQTTDPKFRDSEDRVGSYSVFKLENNELNLKEGWAFVENLFVYGQGNKVVEDAVERYSVKNGAGTLALHSGYQSVFKEVGRDDRGESLLYLQADPRVLKVMPSMAGLYQGMEGAGVVGDEANRPLISVGLQIAEGANAAIRERILVRAPKEAMPASKSVESFRPVTARFAQNDTLYYSATQVNVADALKSLLAKAGKTGSPMQDYIKTLTGATNDAEIVSKLEMFKGEMAFFMSYVSQPSLKFDTIQDVFETFQMVFVIELDRDMNDVAFRDLMRRIEDRTKQSYVPATMRDITIRYQKGAAPREDKGQNPLGLFGNIATLGQDPLVTPFFTCWSRVELEGEAGGQPRKFLLLSDSLNAMRKAVQQAKSVRTSLGEDNRFREMQKALHDNHLDFNYVDLTRLVDIYSTLLPHLGRSGLIARETLNQLPSASALRNHLFPMGWASTRVTDPEGVVVETYSPTGNLPLVTLLGLTAWPLIVDRQSEVVSKQVDTKFKRVMLGLHLYAADFDRYPQQLSDLYPNYVKDFSTFESPFKPGLVKTPQDVDNNELTNMIYVPGHSLQDMGNEVLVYEKDPTRLTKTGDGSQLYHHVITVDGKKNFLTKAALDLRLSGRVDFLTNIAEKNKAANPETPRKGR